MFGLDFVRHAREFLGHVNAHRYEKTPTGFFFPKAQGHIEGIYTHDVNGKDEMSNHNLIPTEGLVYMLQAAVTNDVADITTWYMALYATAYTPLAALNANNFTATTGEITSQSEGWAGSNRIAWVPDAVDTGDTSVSNVAAPSTFTIVTASSLLVEGAGMLSAQVRGAQTGVLISAGRFPATRTLANTDEFNLKYKIDANPV